MNTTEFIEAIGACVQKYAPQYGICVHSPIIAQAVLESARGTSELAVNANNYFGLKYKPGRCPTATGIYYKVGSEQAKDGTYTSSQMQWCRFPNMDACVHGYFDFTNNSGYANLKGVTDPETYLKNIKADGYATSLKYVNNLMTVIKRYNLTRFDGKKVESMSNSTLATYTRISPNKTSPRNHKIDTVTIHCMAGDLTVERCGELFAKRTRMASSNYGIGSDGNIWHTSTGCCSEIAHVRSSRWQYHKGAGRGYHKCTGEIKVWYKKCQLRNYHSKSVNRKAKHA